MASQTPLSKTPPTHQQVRQQLERMRNDRHFTGQLRFPALEWLVTQKFDGRFDKKPRPPASK